MSRIQLRRGTASAWTAANPVLAQGEQALESDTGKVKMGNGSSPWSSLPYMGTTANAPAKPLVIAGNGIGTGLYSTSTTGTSEQFATVGVAATGVTAEWMHWYTQAAGAGDADPATSISFNASLRIVSSSNPNTVVGTIYRITFNGRTTATLDPGGRIRGDIVGISVSPGDVVAIRTYLSSGTAYAPRATYNVGWGGFTTGDLTAPGSAAISSSTDHSYGPSAVLGFPSTASTAKSVLLVGDSIARGSADGAYGGDGGRIPNNQAYSGGGFVLRALSGVAGVLNVAAGGDTAADFAGTNGSFHRLKNTDRCTSAIVEYGTNDLPNGVSASTLETYILSIAAGIRAQGIAKVFVTTLIPRSSSTDGWATVANQSNWPYNSVRVAHNTWIRAGCPIDPTTLAPVAVGTSGALLSGAANHPVTGFFDTAATVESSLNSGRWAACQRVTTGSMSTGTPTTLTSAAANFQTATQETGGDLGTAFQLAGAGVAGAYFVGYISAVNSSTQCTLPTGNTASTTVSSTQLNMGVLTFDGIHPTTRGHYLMAQAINPALL